jgi:hypothetical protein
MASFSEIGRYTLFVSFKKPTSIPAIQSCNIFKEIKASTRPTPDGETVHIYFE